MSVSLILGGMSKAVGQLTVWGAYYVLYDETI